MFAVSNFRLHVTCLEYLAQYAKIVQNTPEHQGVVIYSMADVPLGFGVAAKSTQDARKLDPAGVIVFHQADAGEYLRNEDTLV
ncbi:hypothetical protein CcCBS67573_g02018 [Chytriomyces confervae]|uniref:UPF0113 domain-containing protein n=1 Tax=Chytriomyces confervae TaxID=246404 RepID=A0A507FJW6_9FUNG|nr:hypothetical protein CcCBS67573_g02018 [Chytriomyces confervae]